MPKPIYPQEIKDFVVNLAEDGYEDNYIINATNIKFGITIRSNLINSWFMTNRVFTSRSERADDKAYSVKCRDYSNFKAKVEQIRKQAKQGLVLIYFGYMPGTNNKPIKKLKKSVIKGVYNNYILTEDGAIQFCDIKGVVKVG